jgi:sugar lactone lactonase YvrE
MNYEIEHCVTSHNEIGEAPLWVPEEQRVYWTDFTGSMIWSFQPGTGQTESWKVSLPVVSITRRQNGGFLLVTKAGLAFWDRTTNTCELVANPIAGSETLWFNDGAIDRQGRLVTGTMNCQVLTAPDGCLYRLDPDRTVTCLDSDLAVANGLGFSPDGTVLYLTEQFRGRLLRYDYDPQSGTVSGRRVFAEIPEAEGVPDGLTVDSEGYVWNAHFGGGLITRYAPDGHIDLRIEMPVPVVTCIGFAGDRMNELYVTTGWYGMDAAAQARKPGSGDLYRIKTNFTGLVEPRFRG